MHFVSEIAHQIKALLSAYFEMQCDLSLKADLFPVTGIY